MGKKNALGDDPLSWVKDTGEVEKPEVAPEPEVDNKTDAELQKPKAESVYEPSDVTEKYRNVILGNKGVSGHKQHETATKEGPATMFVIVYTVLILVLGFLVYRDLTKKIDKLDTKLTKIEKQIESSNDAYEKAKLDEIW